jgi:hypothetical protein
MHDRQPKKAPPQSSDKKVVHGSADLWVDGRLRAEILSKRPHKKRVQILIARSIFGSGSSGAQMRVSAICL